MKGQSDTPGSRTLIGVLATHEDPRRHKELVRLLDGLVEEPSLHPMLRNFAFVFTGGTYKRVIEPLPRGVTNEGDRITEETRRFLLEECGVIRLPDHRRGGVVLLTYLVVERRISILWPFLTPVTPHWLQCENSALLRLSDHWRVNRLLNAHSVREWFPAEALRYVNRGIQVWPPPPVVVGSVNDKLEEVPAKDPAIHTSFDFAPRDEEVDGDTYGHTFRLHIPKSDNQPKRRRGQWRLALIAHDELKDRMLEFCIDHQEQLADNFVRIVTTGTTGRVLREGVPGLRRRIYSYHSGAKGGDIQIAAEIIFGMIDTVVFFVDPLRPHPHIDDVRVIFGACMLQPVRMLTNERQAREWMEYLAQTPAVDESLLDLVKPD